MLLGRHLEGRLVVEVRICCQGVDPKKAFGEIVCQEIFA